MSEDGGHRRQCPICEETSSDIKKLKTHILLKHRELHVCLFCVEIKGWSDQFPSQSSYNEHYWNRHGGVIDFRERHRRRTAETLKNDKKLAKATLKRSIIKKNRLGLNGLTCSECECEVQDNEDYERHLISTHNYDYCKICWLMGPTKRVRHHVVNCHRDRLCCVCCGSGPIFKSEDGLRTHLFNSHGIRDGTLYCVECHLTSFSSVESYNDHAKRIHGLVLSAKDLFPMRKRRVSRGRQSQRSDESCDQIISSWNLKDVTGLRNESGSDCFCIAILHLLARTQMNRYFKRNCDSSESCIEAPCLLDRFFNRYVMKKRVFFPKDIISNYYSFGLKELPVDVGDFLRLVLSSVSVSSKNHGLGSRVKSLINVALEWKFECESCQRFMVMKLSDYVLRLDGSGYPTSFRCLINDYLLRRKCVCGKKNDVIPIVKNPDIKYVFVEVDRSIKAENDAKELSLYSLQLESRYALFGGDFAVVGTVNYMLDSEEGGGHYFTNLFTTSSHGRNTVIRVHESIAKETRKKPDFDTDAVIVALCRIDEVIEPNGTNECKETMVGVIESPQNNEVKESNKKDDSSQTAIDVSNALPEEINHTFEELINSAEVDGIKL